MRKPELLTGRECSVWEMGSTLPLTLPGRATYGSSTLRSVRVLPVWTYPAP